MSSQERKMNALLITNSSSGADAIRQQLSQGRDRWEIWHFSDMEEVGGFSVDTDQNADLIIVDLSEFSADSDDPKSCLLRTRRVFPDTPLIVITDRTDHDLMHYAVEEVMADSLSFWQIKGDRRNLLNLIDAVLARFEIAQRLKQVATNVQATSSKKYDDLLAILNNTKSRFDALQEIAQNDAKKYEQEIERLRNEILAFGDAMPK